MVESGNADIAPVRDQLELDVEDEVTQPAIHRARWRVNALPPTDPKALPYCEGV